MPLLLQRFDGGTRGKGRVEDIGLLADKGGGRGKVGEARG